jgi:hypothetical protein
MQSPRKLWLVEAGMAVYSYPPNTKNLDWPIFVRFRIRIRLIFVIFGTKRIIRNEATMNAAERRIELSKYTASMVEFGPIQSEPCAPRVRYSVALAPCATRCADCAKSSHL